MVLTQTAGESFFSFFRVLFRVFFILLIEKSVCNNSGPNLIFKLLKDLAQAEQVLSELRDFHF